MIELRAIQAVVTDIEGTTSSLSFVTEQLFAYARRYLPAYVRDHAAQLAAIAEQVKAAAGRGTLSTDEMIELLLQWMDQDRKLSPLKTLQGMIWKGGYECGELRGHVYEDAVRALRRWHASGIRICIYSSGSVEAQKLLFAHSSHGDLTPLITDYFDTSNGSKLESQSYQRIAGALAVPASALVFLSDHSGETHAAAAAGMHTVLLARTQAVRATEPIARSFDDIALHA